MGIQSHYFMANRRGKCETILDFLFLGSKITANGDSSHEIRRWLLLGRKVITPIKCVVKQRYQTAYKGPCSQNYGLPSGLVRLWELDEKEGRVPNNWCLWTVLLRKNSESPLDTEEIKPVSLKEIIWTLILTGRKDAKTSVFWSLDVNSELIGKLSDAGRDWGQKEKGASEDEMAGWHHWCNGHELGQPWEMVREREACHAAVHGIIKSPTWLGNWTTTTSKTKKKTDEIKTSAAKL